DARFVVFESGANGLVAGPGSSFGQIYLRDRSTSITERASVSSSGAPANVDCLSPSVSDDGRYVAFMTYASNLVAGDTNVAEDVFVRDRISGTTTRASLSSTGQKLAHGSFYPDLSGDGTRVVFESDDDQVVAGDTNSANDVFVRDLATGTNIL